MLVLLLLQQLLTEERDKLIISSCILVLLLHHVQRIALRSQWILIIAGAEVELLSSLSLLQQLLFHVCE